MRGIFHYESGVRRASSSYRMRDNILLLNRDRRDKKRIEAVWIVKAFALNSRVIVFSSADIQRGYLCRRKN